MQDDHRHYVLEYVNFLRGFLCDDVDTSNAVFDCSNGAAGPIIERLFPDSIIVNGKPDGNFPNHAPDPLHAGSLDMLMRKVVSERADIGIIFDADGDRAFFVDDTGRSVDPDVIAYLLLWSLRPEKFISEVKAGWLIKQQSLGAKRTESKTGHYFFKQAIRKHGAEFGHEESGHYYFKDFFYCDSGIMAAIEVLNAITKLPYTLSEFVDLLPNTYISAEINFSVPFAAHDALLARIERTYAKDAAHRSTLDGITLEFNNPDWWFNVRFSNTEPLARLRVEARDTHVYDAQLKKLTELLKNSKQKG